MLKKLLIAAVAVLVGLVLINKSSLIKALWRDAQVFCDQQVPPEVRLKQLRVQIEDIDKDIKKNLSRLAAQEVDVQMLEARVEEMRTKQQKLRADIGDMEKGLEARTERVSFKGTSYRSGELARKLEMGVVDFKNLKEQLKTNEALLADKKRTLEAAHARISAMRNQKEELRTVLAKLETQLEVVKQKQIESRVVDVDDSAVTKARQLADKIEVDLRRMETEARLNRDYGYATQPSELTKPAKSTDEVLKSARQALEEDREQPEKVASEK